MTYATYALGAVLAVLYWRAYRAARAGDGKETCRRLVLPGPLLLVFTLINVVRGDASMAAVWGAMTTTSLWAFTNYRTWGDGEEPEAELPVDVLTSDGGES